MILAGYDTSVDPSYHQFGLHDPTCAEGPNFAQATVGASRDVVGWAPNAVAVQVVTDLVRIAVRIEVLDGAPDPDEAELSREGELQLPGGQVSLPKSPDASWMVGVALAPGPGTYRVRVCGYRRERARQLREALDLDSWEAGIDTLRGVEAYRIQLWQVSTEPAWPEDDD